MCGVFEINNKQACEQILQYVKTNHLIYQIDEIVQMLGMHFVVVQTLYLSDILILFLIIY